MYMLYINKYLRETYKEYNIDDRLFPTNKKNIKIWAPPKIFTHNAKKKNFSYRGGKTPFFERVPFISPKKGGPSLLWYLGKKAPKNRESKKRRQSTKFCLRRVWERKEKELRYTVVFFF